VLPGPGVDGDARRQAGLDAPESTSSMGALMMERVSMRSRTGGTGIAGGRVVHSPTSMKVSATTPSKGQKNRLVELGLGEGDRRLRPPPRRGGAAGRVRGPGLALHPVEDLGRREAVGRQLRGAIAVSSARSAARQAWSRWASAAFFVARERSCARWSASSTRKRRSPS
jgi:hypothetical protein